MPTPSLSEDRPTLEKAKAVVETAEANPDNARIQKLKTDMDRTHSVNGAYKRLRVLRQPTHSERDASTSRRSTGRSSTNLVVPNAEFLSNRSLCSEAKLQCRLSFP